MKHTARKISQGSYEYRGWWINKDILRNTWLIYAPNTTIRTNEAGTLKEAKVLINRIKRFNHQRYEKPFPLYLLDLKAIPLMLERAKAVNAPIGKLRNIRGPRWHQSSRGQTYVPPRVLRDLRSGRGISLAQAKKIVEKFERQAAEGREV